MKTDAYTKIILTVIAVCLSVIVLKQINIIPSAYAQAPDSSADVNTKYGLVPVNDDGTIDVNIKSSSIIMEANITKVGNYFVYSRNLPVSIEKNNDK